MGPRLRTVSISAYALWIVSQDKMQYSGANRPLIMVRNGELIEFRPDKMTIGVAPLKETLSQPVLEVYRPAIHFIFSPMVFGPVR